MEDNRPSSSKAIMNKGREPSQTIRSSTAQTTTISHTNRENNSNYIKENKDILLTRTKRKQMTESLRARTNRFRKPSTFLADLVKEGRYNVKEEPEYAQNFKQFSTPLSRQLVEQYRNSVRNSEYYFDEEQVQMTHESAFSEAIELFERGELDESLVIMTDVIAGLPTQETLSFCAQVMMKKHLYEEAIDILTRVIEMNPMNPAPYLNRGECYVQLGMSDQARDEIDKYLKLEVPSDYQVLITLGKCRATTNDHVGALDSFDKAIAMAEEQGQPNAYAYYLRGDVYYQMDNIERASTDFKKVIEIDPDFPKPYEQTALEHEEHDEYREAISVYQSLLKLYPLKSYYHLKIGLLYYYMGKDQLEKAFDSLDKFHENIRVNFMDDCLEEESEGYLVRGILIHQQMNFHGAIDNYSICIEMNFESTMAKALRHRAECYIELQKPNDAFKDYSYIVDTLHINYGPALKYLFRYPFLQEPFEESSIDHVRSFDLLFRALEAKRGIHHWELRERDYKTLLGVEDEEPVEPKSRKSSRSASRVSHGSRTPSAKTPAPTGTAAVPPPSEASASVVELPPLSPLEEEQTKTREMVAHVIVHLFTHGEREKKRREEEEALAANPKQKKPAESNKKKQAAPVLSLCELSIEAYHKNLSYLPAGPPVFSPIVESTRSLWSSYQLDFGRVVPDNNKKKPAATKK